jgi:molybdopterin-guanine dinucleotide biosynthesis protein A/molybdopterin converting factor small subunit
MLSAVILAGGRSSRMGTPKSLLPFDGEPLIVHIVRTLEPLFGEIIVVAAPNQELPPIPARVVHDDVGYQGPVGGIYYGLRAAGGEGAFVTSCDSAFLNPALISHLVSVRAGVDVVVPHWDGRYQPLLAVYGHTVLPLLAAQLERGELRPVYLFDKVRTRLVEEEEIRRFDPDGESFFNMNTPADYNEALKRWRAAPPPTPGVSCTIELFGVARLLAQTREVPLTLPAEATLGQMLAALVERLPALAGTVIAGDQGRLVDGYACNVNGLDFVRQPGARIYPGDNIAIMSADAGG